MKRMSKPDFERWLSGMSARTKVGTTQTAFYCPLASYLGRDGQKFSVGLETYSTLWGEEDFDLPKWAKKFVRRIDEVSPHGPRPITAGACLKELKTL